MKRHEQLALDIADMIKTGVLAVGERVPSARHASKTYRISPSTVYQAYFLLENRGMIRSKPRSGYFVCSQPQHAVPRSKRLPRALRFTDIDVSELAFSVLGSLRDPDIVPLGSAFPSPPLFPISRLSRKACRHWKGCH